MSAPRTSAWFIARASSCGPSSVTGVMSIVSARKPMVWALAMLLAITRWRIIDARHAGQRGEDQAVHSVSCCDQVRRLMTVCEIWVAVSIALAFAWK